MNSWIEVSVLGLSVYARVTVWLHVCAICKCYVEWQTPALNKLLEHETVEGCPSVCYSANRRSSSMFCCDELTNWRSRGRVPSVLQTDCWLGESLSLHESELIGWECSIDLRHAVDCRRTFHCVPALMLIGAECSSVFWADCWLEQCSSVFWADFWLEESVPECFLADWWLEESVLQCSELTVDWSRVFLSVFWLTGDWRRVFLGVHDLLLIGGECSSVFYADSCLECFLAFLHLLGAYICIC